jgi:hypothetical protein
MTAALPALDELTIDIHQDIDTWAAQQTPSSDF